MGLRSARAAWDSLACTLSGVGLQHLRRLAEAYERSYGAVEMKLNEDL